MGELEKDESSYGILDFLDDVCRVSYGTTCIDLVRCTLSFHCRRSKHLPGHLTLYTGLTL